MCLFQRGRMLGIIIGILFSTELVGRPLTNPSLTTYDTIKVSSRNKFETSDSIGQYLQVNRILIIGNKLTRNSIILRELRFKKGDIINEVDLPSVIEKDKRKLFNLHLFNTATIKPLDLGNGLVDLLVEVEERWYTFPVPRFQLSDRNFNEWWENYNHDFNRVNYGIKLYQYNVWGRNHTLLLKAQFGFQKNFQFIYRIPYINKEQKQGLILEADFMQSKNAADSTINHKLEYIKFDRVLRTTKGIGLTYTYRNNFYIQHKLKYEYRQTSIADTLASLNPNYLGSENLKQKFDALTYEFVSDHRDVVAYPLNGYALNVGIRKSGVALHKDLNKTEASLSFAGFKDLKKGLFLSNLSFLYLSTPNNLPYFNYGSMGYDKIFVRGYEIYVVEGPQFFLNKTTLKKRLLSKNWHVNIWSFEQFNYFPLAIYLKTYADFGYVNNYQAYEKNSVNTLFANKIIAGAGFGIDIVTGYDLAIRLEYTFNAENSNGFFLHFKKEF